MTEHISTSVVAQDAPIGIPLWPSTQPESFTLRHVSIVRNHVASWVVWTYWSGQERTFELGEKVAVQVEARHAHLVGTTTMPKPKSKRTKATTNGVWITPNQEAALKWFATGNIGYVAGVKTTEQTYQRLWHEGLVAKVDTNPYWEATPAAGSGWRTTTCTRTGHARCDQHRRGPRAPGGHRFPGSHFPDRSTT